MLSAEIRLGKGENMPNERKPAKAPDRAQAEIDHLDALLDEGLRETFPASDPVAISFRKKSQSDGRSSADEQEDL